MSGRREAVAGAYAESAIYMDTLITVEIVGGAPIDECAPAVSRCFEWFETVERHCSRFDERSELTLLSRSPIREPVAVSALLFQQIEFALAVARASDGAFDPAVGRAMESAGFDHNYATGQRISSPRGETGSFRDIVTDPANSTVTLLRPLVLDLGAVAKGFAIDLAAAELSRFHDFAINAGGDVYARGRNRSGAAWRIGIRHPRLPGKLLETLTVTNAAVCTSGDYERPRESDAGHHIIEPRTGRSARSAAAVTVIAPTAVVADALSTAAFALGPERGIEFLEAQGVEGIIVTPGIERFATAGIADYLS
jgi:thiamine biosynthesis lipoprotein